MKIDHCASSPCNNKAMCESLAEGYMCSCRPGYEGIQCEVNTDECANNPCQNYGTCADGINSYTCICKAGFTGLHCETDINECLSDPCQNGGQCVDKENGFECICKPTYSGETCSKSKTLNFLEKLILFLTSIHLVYCSPLLVSVIDETEMPFKDLLGDHKNQ